MDHAHSFESKKKALTLAVLAWNLSLMSPVSRWLELRKISKELATSEDHQLHRDFRFLVRQLITRKKEQYADIKRWIIDFEYIETSHAHHLNVVSTVLQGSKADPGPANIKKTAG